MLIIAKTESWRFPVFLVALSLMLVGFCSVRNVLAQMTGATLTGAVTDPSGAAIPRTTVLVKNTAARAVPAITAGSLTGGLKGSHVYDVHGARGGFCGECAV